MKKDNDFVLIWSRKLKRFLLSYYKERREDEKFVGCCFCDVDFRLFFDGGRILFEKFRVLWDGCLIEKLYSKLMLLFIVMEMKKFGGEEEEEEGEEKSLGGMV